MRKVKVGFAAPGQGVEDFSDGRLLADTFPDITLPIYEEVQKATNVDVLAVCDKKVDSTDIAKVLPAQLGIGVAHAKILESMRIKPDYIIGLSVGEFTGATINKSIPSIEKAARYVQARSESQTRIAGGKGTVVTIRHKGDLDIAKLLRGLDGVWYTGNHSPKLTGFSLKNASLNDFKKRVEEQGARLIPSIVSFAAHCEEVAEAQAELDNLIGEEDLKDSNTTMISIRLARAMRKGRIIRNELIWQTTKPTDFNGAVNEAIKRGVTEFYPLAPGPSMEKMLGSIIGKKDITIHTLNSLIA